MDHWISVRRMFGQRDPGWSEHVEFLGLTHLLEVRTVDTVLNEVVEGEVVLESLEEALLFSGFQGPSKDSEYCLLYTQATAESASYSHPSLNPLGYDLSDNPGGPSSLLNCGRWSGVLEPIANRSKSNGLLELDDAKEAARLLPEAWSGDPHAYVFVWALFELSLQPFSRAYESRNSWGLSRNPFPFINRVAFG